MNSIQTASLIAAALASVMGCYTVSIRASSERAAVITANQQIASDVAEMRLLRAELRTRSRLPELQRWNEQVLALAPPRAEQLIANPVMLANYAAPSTSAAAVATVNAVVRDAAAPAPILRRASFAPVATHDLGTDAARVGGAVGTVDVSFRKVALR